MKDRTAKMFARAVESIQQTRVIQCSCWYTCQNHDRQKDNRLLEALTCSRKYVYMLNTGMCAYFTPVEVDE